jgi:hypothetical protein
VGAVDCASGSKKALAPLQFHIKLHRVLLCTTIDVSQVADIKKAVTMEIAGGDGL